MNHWEVALKTSEMFYKMFDVAGRQILADIIVASNYLIVSKTEVNKSAGYLL